MMKKVFFVLISLIIFLSGAAAQDNPVTWSSAVVKSDENTYVLKFTARIDSPWHLYDMEAYVDGPNPTTISFEESGDYSLVGEISTSPAPTRVFDEMFGMEIGYFEGEVVFSQRIRLSDGVSEATISALAEWMCCNDMSCTPPAEMEFEIAVGSAEGAVGAAETTSSTASESAAETAVGSSVSISELSTSVAPESLESRPLWRNILEAIMWGLAALMTPCVFPMIPMTVSFFIKKTGSKAKISALAFGLSIVALYTLPIAIIIAATKILGGDAITVDILGWLATHWLPNIIFFVVFMIFAMSFFGAFEIVLPSKLVNQSDAKADKGGLVGILFMALTLVLVSFSCTGPIVGSVLISSTSGAVWTPAITMLAFSVAFALPFTLLAMFPSLLTQLPKSGSWLSSVKVVLGFIELALGLKFLSIADQTYHWGLLDREVFLALWIVIFALLGLYLLGKIRFAGAKVQEHLSVPRLMMSIVVFAFVVYMIPGMWGAPLKGLSGYLPPIRTQDFVALSTASPSISNQTSTSTSSSLELVEKPKYSDFLHLPHGLQGFFTLDEALEYSRKVGKPVFFSYTGHGCVNCREMEAKVWSDPRVLEMLREEFVLVSLYSDDKKTLPEDEWVTTASGRVLKSIGKINVYQTHSRYGINSQPYYMILDNDGDQMVKGRGYNTSIDGFLEFLSGGLAAFYQQN